MQAAYNVTQVLIAIPTSHLITRANNKNLKLETLTTQPSQFTNIYALNKGAIIFSERKNPKLSEPIIESSTPIPRIQVPKQKNTKNNQKLSICFSIRRYKFLQATEHKRANDSKTPKGINTRMRHSVDIGWR